MEVSQPPERCLGLPPLVGTRLVIVSNGLERGYDRARGLDDLGYRVAASGDVRGAPEFVGEFQPDAHELRDVRIGPEVSLRRPRALILKPDEHSRLFDAFALFGF